MSQRPPGGDRSGSSTREGGNNGGTTGQRSSSSFGPPVSQAVSDSYRPAVISPTAQTQLGNSPRSFELPPLPAAFSNAAGRSAPSGPRIGGVSSILNPPETEEQQQGRRRKASQLESPTSSIQSLPPILAGPQAQRPPSSLSAQSPSAQHAPVTESAPRRILTPRSPSLHRAASLGQLNSSTGTISAQTNPFPASPRGRTYTVEPGVSGAPPLPISSAYARTTHDFPAPTPPTQTARRASVGASRGRALSSSASPTSSYSSYDQTGQTSPAAQYERTTLAAPYASAGETMGASGTTSAPPTTMGPGNQRQMGIPISSSGGQNVYQMLTLETTSGTVQLPVDVQAASRVADEKRRRNAGASARFRQRRKEKEKEATTTIGRLEQQFKEATEDAEFYRRERDFLAGILGHIPGGERHFPRPSSPRHRRASGLHLSGNDGSAYGVPQESGARSPDQGRNVRRRTSTFSLPPPPVHQTPMPGPGVPIQPNFGAMPPQAPPSALQSPSGPLPSPLSRGHLPFPGALPPGQSVAPPPGPPQVLQTVPQPGPWNPYASERRSSGPSNPQREAR